MGNRFVWEDDDITVRTDNKGLTCEDCILRLEKPGFCYAYAAKPKNILHGGSCEKKIQEKPSQTSKVEFDTVLKQVETYLERNGRKLMIAGETDDVWIFRGTFLKKKHDINSSIIADKTTGEMRYANNLYDEEIMLNAKLIIDNRNNKDCGPLKGKNEK